MSKGCVASVCVNEYNKSSIVEFTFLYTFEFKFFLLWWV